MTEITLDVLIEQADDYIREVGKKNELRITLLGTSVDEQTTFRSIVIAGDTAPLPINHVCWVISAMQKLDQVVLIAESTAWRLDMLSTADIMRFTKGECETADELARALSTGGANPNDLPATIKKDMITLVGQSRRGGQNRQFLMTYGVEGEIPHRRFVPREGQTNIPEGATNTNVFPIMLEGFGPATWTREQSHAMYHAAEHLAHRDIAIMLHAELDPDVAAEKMQGDK